MSPGLTHGAEVSWGPTGDWLGYRDLVWDDLAVFLMVAHPSQGLFSW